MDLGLATLNNFSSTGPQGSSLVVPGLGGLGQEDSVLDYRNLIKGGGWR